MFVTENRANLIFLGKSSIISNIYRLLLLMAIVYIR